MKTPIRLVLLAAFLTSALTLKAQTLLTDFSTASGWGTSTHLVGSSGTFDITGGVADFTVDSPADSEFAYMKYNGAVGSYSSDWSVQIDVNYAIPANIFSSGIEQFINLGLMVTTTGVTPGVASNAPNFNAFMIQSNLYQDAANVRSRDIRTAVFAPGSATDDANRYAQTTVSAATATAVQISYNATTQVLTAGFDADGAAGGYSFTAIGTLTAAANTWGMTGSDTFSIHLMANSGYDGGATGVGPVIGTGEATLDNLSGTNLTAVPEPSTYAAIAGVLALGLAAWRRQRRIAARA
ncbi:MAG: PEP-CTERM sorting domain-containing protein [Lacunisphaera sp.]|nr:PEP-CTERM sorting domain-containing protein [Lacunisphaera sp.]